MSTTTVPTIDVATLTSWLAQNHPFTMLDVRPTDQRREWSIPGSIHIDAAEALWADRPEVLDNLVLPRNVPVVTICAAGKTSLLAADYLQTQGYHALSLEGGMQAWSLAWNYAVLPLAGSAAQVIQVRRLGKGCLSYVLGSDGLAAVIDPSLPAHVYRELAHTYGWRITHVLETHIHADHLSRARRLADLAGAQLFLPEQGRVSFSASQVSGGASIALGESRLEVLATPGHTGESISYLLDGRALFTGDTLSLGGVGRPDLAQDAGGARRQSSQLYASLQELLKLPDGTIVLPAHTGEPIGYDGKPIARALGELRGQFSDLRLSEEAFVERVLARLPAVPANYLTIIKLNEAGECPEHESGSLEVGANRCTVAA